MKLVQAFIGVLIFGVAPHAGARIETYAGWRRPRVFDYKSLPTRERGLKQNNRFCRLADCLVAPHAGARIETEAHFVGNRRQPVAPHAGARIETARL